MTKLYLAIVFYFHLESFAFLLMYHVQDNIGADNVFYAIHTIYAAFDIFILVGCVLNFRFSGQVRSKTLRWWFLTSYSTRATQIIQRRGLTLNQGLVSTWPIKFSFSGN